MDGVTDIAIRGLGRSAEPTLRPGEVMRTLSQLAQSPAEGDPVTAFESLYARFRREQRRQQTPERVWTFYWPVRITLGDDVKRGSAVTVLGTRYHLSPAVALVRRLGSRQLEPAST